MPKFTVHLAYTKCVYETREIPIDDAENEEEAIENAKMEIEGELDMRQGDTVDFHDAEIEVEEDEEEEDEDDG